jgi:hypothetical protein
MTTSARLCDRIDSTRYTVAPPRAVPGTGGVIYQAVLAVPGTYHYPALDAWVCTPAETLADKAFCDSLQGVAVIDDDQLAHVEGVTTTTMQDEAIGRVMGAWWDDAQQALVGDVLIDVQRGLNAVRMGVDGVSVGYDVDLVAEAGDGYTFKQARRYDPSNVAITRTPRHGVTRLRAADSGALPMNPELLKTIQAKVGDAADPMAMFETLIKMVLEHSARATDLERQLAEATVKLGEQAGVAVEVPEGDAVPGAGMETPAEEVAEAKAADMADTYRAADSLGLTIDPTWTVADLDRAVREHAISAVLASAKSGRVGDAWDRASQAGAREQRNRTTTHSPTDV